MSTAPKFFFDECVGRPIMETVEQKLQSQGVSVTFSHLKDRFAEKQLDEDWIPQIAPEGWVIITSDQARKRSKGGRLPELCIEYEVTHVLIGTTLHHKSSGEKEKALLDAWGDIMKLTSVPKGSRYRLHLNNDGQGTLEKLQVSPKQ